MVLIHQEIIDTPLNKRIDPFGAKMIEFAEKSSDLEEEEKVAPFEHVKKEVLAHDDDITNPSYLES